VLLVLLLYPPVVGSLAVRAFTSRVSDKLGRPVRVASGRGGFGQVVLKGIVIEGPPGRPPLMTAKTMTVPLSVALGGTSPITVTGLRLEVVRGGERDNVSDIITRLEERRGRGKGQAGGPAGAEGDGDKGKPGSKIPGVFIEDGSLTVRDGDSGLQLEVKEFGGSFLPSERVHIRLTEISGVLAIAGGEKGPKFGAAELEVSGELAGLGPRGYPSLRVVGGFATPLPSLALTGIAGTVGPATLKAETQTGKPSERLVIDLRGSYGGAKEALWTARGGANPKAREGTLSLRAERFSLDKIADVLPRSVLTPARTSIDSAFEIKWAGQAVSFGGALRVAGLSLEHQGLASAPVEDLSLELLLRGISYPERRRVQLELFEARIGDLVGRLAGALELAPGSYTFADGSKLGFLPKIDLQVEVPPIPCAKLLASIPAALLPKLQGFVLKGNFEALVGTKIDFADLDALDLTGKVGIGGCKVLKAPEAVAALATSQSIVQTVEVPKAMGVAAAPGETELKQFIVGPENPDFVPYEQISPYLINSIMTTEDNGFFRHRGWVSSEFKSALRRNLERGGFRLGASSITMQMVKNVLLSREKTLSRKLQELFLVWYIEQLLPKERILELYFNAIEFGPRIYGIGPAVRHYFGKRPFELSPLEAAFFSSILPSPKRRYIQYCHGSLFPPWDKYVRRIMLRAYERGRLTDVDYELASASTLTFDRQEATFTEKQCMDWVKRITYRPEPELPPDLEAGADGGELAKGEGAPKRSKRLLTSGPRVSKTRAR
jgi:hypothetical protein